MGLRPAQNNEIDVAMNIINMAKKHLKEQGIDQWQNGYPDHTVIQNDIRQGKGFFVIDGDEINGYLCIDFDGEPAYETLNGEWVTDDKYVVVHRMAFTDSARGKGISTTVFNLVEEMAREKGIRSFRVDTDEANLKMQHVLKKNGFTYRGTIWFDNSQKIAFDKIIRE